MPHFDRRDRTGLNLYLNSKVALYGTLFFVILYIYVAPGAYRTSLLTVPAEGSHQELSPAAFVDEATRNGVSACQHFIVARNVQILTLFVAVPGEMV